MAEKSKFKQMIAADVRSTFLNLDEFAEIHSVEGNDISIIFAPDIGIQFGKGYEFGVAKSSVVIHADIKDLPKRKESGESLNVDGREYIIDEWNENDGIAEIKLSQTRGI